MAFIEPGYHMHSATHITNLIKRRHSQLQLKVKEKITLEAQSLSLTSDIWTSQANDVYISCHYVSPEWGELESFVLSTKGFTERHTG